MDQENKNIIRVEKRDNPYLIIDKTGLTDDRLSWKAKGLLAYLLSLPDDWTVRERDLAKRSKDGRDSTRSGIQELINNGYVIRKRLHDANGKFDGWETIVYELPQKVEETPKGDSPPRSEKPTTGKPISENPTYTKYPVEYLSSELNATTTTTANNQMNGKDEQAVTSETGLIDTTYQTAQEAYMKAGWGLPNPFTVEMLQDDIKDYGIDIVLHAIEIAATSTARSYRYTQSMYKEWNDKGLKTIEQVKQYEDAKVLQRQKQFDRKQGVKPVGTSKPKPKNDFLGF